MKRFVYYLLFSALLYPLSAFAQQAFDFSDDAVIARLKEDIYTLASEEMEGREAGTPGEARAAEYIKMRMQEVGLEPVFDDSFYQEFPFPGEWVWGENNHLSVAGHDFRHGDDYYVLPGSAAGEWTASYVYVGFGLGETQYEGYDDYALLDDLDGKFFVMEFFLPAELDTLPDLRTFQMIFQKMRLAQEKGAAGIIFVNSQSEREDPPVDLRMSRRGFDIPLLFAEETLLDHLLSDTASTLSLQTDIFRKDHTGINVAGYLDMQAEYTVVIGAHYDHVGYGAQGSRRPGSNEIHYGADDNASGTAGILEAARYISDSDAFGNYNYLFIAFSAEEKGLVGSRYFTESDAYDMEKINYMFNLDMIGRMEENTLTLIGTGTSPVWDELIDSTAPEHFNIRKNPGGRGGSDHTSFYLKDIPVIFFFTGVHEDYHTPGDTPDKIDYKSTLEIIQFSLNLVKALENKDKLAFSSAPSPAGTQRRTDGVTLGVMPDHGFDGEGLRIMTVTADRPAYHAGMVSGDIIISINELPVREIHSYMEALSGLSPNTKATVVVLRDEEKVELEVSF
ncbi:MAG: M20/M25/M40 family metallo-hydrolase [Bacteroidales bacterium]|nr:M20/M25/M40 family metallo-hydrolase [Bacteroidales bacterium]